MSNNLITVNENFTVPAGELQLQKYLASSTLGNAEKEEAAVRLLIFSQEKKEYVGVPWGKVASEWFNEAREYTKQAELYSAKYNEFQNQLLIFYKKNKDYENLAWKTLGLSLLFIKKPTVPVFDTPLVPKKDSHSITLELGLGDPQKLIDAFLDLIEEGLIKTEILNDTDYFFPTPILVSKITGR